MTGPPQAPEAEPPPFLRLATYNVHGCVGVDRYYAPGRVAEIVAALRADIIALQEVDGRRPLHAGLAQFEFFERATGLHAVAGPNIRGDRGEYGNLLLTRFPITRIRRIDLSQPGREPRGALDVDLDTPYGPLRVVTLHLGLARAERDIQIRRIAGILGDPAATAPRTVLMGDFNEWFRGAAARLAAITARFPTAHTPRSFPAPLPLLPLDRIYVRPAPHRVHAVAPVMPLARRASDHLPVALDIAWEPPPAR